MHGLRRPTRPGFTFFDLMITITIMALVAAVIVPTFKDDEQLHLIAGSRLLTSDIEMAQLMTISNPEEPVVIRFEPGAGRYWLATADDVDTPIPRPGGSGEYTVQFGVGDARSAAGVSLSLTDVTDSTLAFNAHGGVADFGTAPEIQLTRGLRWIKLTIHPTTGTITESIGNG
jgi:hypothetical protein